MPRLALPERLERRVQAFLAAGPPDVAGRVVLVGVSGGADSVCLLHAVARVAPCLALTPRVAHVHHGLRGASSDADAALVERHAGQLGLAFDLARVDVPTSAADRRMGAEEAARSLRYEALGALARAAGAVGVLVGHTADDAAETFLINLLRGTGPEGLAGIPARRPLGPDEMRSDEAGGVWLLRPLLETRRAETAAYCRQRGLETALDASNLDPTYLRNRVRHHLLPVLASYNPNVVEALLRTARLVDADQALLDALARETFRAVALVSPGEVALNWEGWGAVPPRLRGRLIRLALEALGAPPPPFGVMSGVERLLARRSAGKWLALGGGASVATERRGIAVRYETA